MDSKNTVKALLMVLCFFLSACAALPSQNFKFSLGAGNAKSASWSQNNLPSSAEMIFKFRLVEAFPKAAEVEFSFVGLSKHDPELTVRLSDEGCSGAYQVTVNHKSGSREFQSYYFKNKLLWDESALIVVRWESGRVSIKINNRESHDMELLDSIRGVNVEMKKGGIEVEELQYRNLKN